MNCGNFLNSTDAKSCGVEVGYGKLFLIYAEKQIVNVSSLNAGDINAAIAAGAIVGVLKDWDEVAGAPVAEVTAERSGSKKTRVLSDEILADTITFDNSPCLNETLARLSRKRTAEVLFVDDNGNVYGEETYASATIGTMTVSFGSKTSTSLQSDNTNVNNLAITVRYLYKKLRAVAVGFDYDLIVSKYEVVLRDFTTAAGGACTVKVFDNCSGSLATDFASVKLDIEVLVNGIPQTPTAVTATNGVIGFTLSAMITPSSVVTIKVVSDDAFSQYVTFIIPTPAP